MQACVGGAHSAYKCARFQPPLLVLGHRRPVARKAVVEPCRRNCTVLSILGECRYLTHKQSTHALTFNDQMSRPWIARALNCFVSPASPPEQPPYQPTLMYTPCVLLPITAVPQFEQN